MDAFEPLSQEGEDENEIKLKNEKKHKKKTVKMIKIIRFGEPPLIACGFSRRSKLTFLGWDAKFQKSEGGCVFIV